MIIFKINSVVIYGAGTPVNNGEFPADRWKSDVR